MAGPFQNFVDKVGPVLSALWLNAVDRLQAAVSADATGKVTVAAPTTGVALTINASSSPGNAQIILGALNSSLDLEVRNTSLGTSATSIVDVGDGANFGFLELQGVNSNAQVTHGVAGSAVNIGSNGVFPVFICANDIAWLEISGTGVISGWGPVAAAFVDMTPDSGSFVATATGFTAAVTGTAIWRRHGKMVFLFVPVLAGTSNATGFTFTGLPAAIQPATIATQSSCVFNIQNNGVVSFDGQANVSAGSGTVTFLKAGNAAGWTASGAKGLGGFTIGYLLD